MRYLRFVFLIALVSGCSSHEASIGSGYVWQMAPGQAIELKLDSSNHSGTEIDSIIRHEEFPIANWRVEGNMLVLVFPKTSNSSLQTFCLGSPDSVDFFTLRLKIVDRNLQAQFGSIGKRDIAQFKPR